MLGCWNLLKTRIEPGGKRTMHHWPFLHEKKWGTTPEFETTDIWPVTLCRKKLQNS